MYYINSVIMSTQEEQKTIKLTSVTSPIFKSLLEIYDEYKKKIKVTEIKITIADHETYKNEVELLVSLHTLFNEYFSVTIKNPRKLLLITLEKMYNYKRYCDHVITFRPKIDLGKYEKIAELLFALRGININECTFDSSVDEALLYAAINVMMIYKNYDV